MFRRLMVRSVLVASALLPLAACDTSGLPAMGDDAGVGSDAGDPGPGSGGGSGNGSDMPPVDPGPFPSDAKPGQFASAFFIEGAADPVRVAVANDGSIFVAARQVGTLKAGNIELPPPSSSTFVVVKLTASSTPVWARAFAAQNVEASSIATTPNGDVAIVGSFTGALNLGQGALANAGGSDGFVIRLAGANGDTRWAAPIGSASDDFFNGVAADSRVGGSDDVYVYGALASDAMIDGEAVGHGGCLISYDGTGARRWAKSFPTVTPHYDEGLALDPEHGPWITARFYGTLELAGHVLVADVQGSDASDVVVAGFDKTGAPRFAHQIVDEQKALSRRLAVGPTGDIYFASDTHGGALVVDDHIIWNLDTTNDSFLLRLTPQGQHAWSKVLAARNSNDAADVAVDVTGAAYSLSNCDGKVETQPEIACDHGPGGVIVSYGPDNEYRWSTSIQPARVDSIDTAPNGRLIVAGEARGNSMDFGGVAVTGGSGVFVASLVTGPAPVPASLPPAPAITSVEMTGAIDTQIRQGGTGTLVIHGSGLDRVTSARLGSIDVHVGAGGTPGELQLSVAIPHGYTPGPLRLVLGNAGGTASINNAVQVTPVVVSAAGTSNGRGTYSSPMKLCRDDWYPSLRFTDVLLLRNGVHDCNKDLSIPRGVIVRGESRTGAIVRGSYEPFRGFVTFPSGLGTSAVEHLTIENAAQEAIKVWSGRMRVSDVDIKNASDSGIKVSYQTHVTVDHYRYLQGSAAGIEIESGDVTATAIETTGVYGVFITDGKLNLSNSTLVGSDAAIRAGSDNTQGGTRDVAVSNSTLRSKRDGVTAALANVTIDGSTIEEVAGSESGDGIHLSGGTLTINATAVRGWDRVGVDLMTPIGDISWLAASPNVPTVTATIDGATINAATGISYLPFTSAGPNSGVTLRRSSVTSTFAALEIYGNLDTIDLGTSGSPGQNKLAAGANSFAIIDHRDEAGPPITAYGTTLNGTTFHGDVLGPVAVPGIYDVKGPNKIDFGP